MSAAVRCVGAACVIFLAACTTPPGSPPLPRDDLPLDSTRVSANAAAYEQRLREAALGQTRSGRLAEAAMSWEILSVLRPDSLEYRTRLSETRRVIDATLPERMQRATQAQKRGDLDLAASHFLGVLALQPDNAAAADGLRAIERERNRRTVLGKPSRLTLTKRSVASAQMTDSQVVVPIDRNELEHATMLGTQGEFDDAIALIESHIAGDENDPATCRLLADLYYQRAVERLPRDKAAAVVSLEKSVRIDPTNARAVERLRQLKGSPSAARPAKAGVGRGVCGSGS